MVKSMFWKALNFPRFRLITLPTPLEKAKNLSKELNVELYIKRDDVMDLALGGNKARKLEFLIADALSKGCDTIITRGAYHSNHARLTAAAARKAGLEAHLVLYPPGEKISQGNIILEELMGAKIHPLESPEEADGYIENLKKELEAEGKKVYVIPGGGASAYGVLGYVVAALELLEQFYSIGKMPKYVVHATGTGATQAGLVLGFKLLGADVKVIGISISRTVEEEKERVRNLIEETKKLLEVDIEVKDEDIIVRDEYRFGGYAVISKEVVDTMKYVARMEGLILDPVYTAKAMYGLIDLIKRGIIEKESVVTFLHTGGTPIVFQKVEEITKYL